MLHWIWCLWLFSCPELPKWFPQIRSYADRATKSHFSLAVSCKASSKHEQELELSSMMQLKAWVSQLLLSGSAAQSVVELSTYDWTLQNENGSINIPASFPSYVHLDLFNANITDDPEYGLNEYSVRWVWQTNWTYSANLTGL